MLSEGDTAPDFELQDQRGNTVSLSDYQGSWVVVWWIPSTIAEMTPPCCDKIANGFGANLARRPELNVVGLSFDTRLDMRTFAMRALVVFPLLSDESKEVGEAYGVRRGEGKDWDCFPIKRAFLVDPQGKIEKVYMNIDPDFFVPEVLHDLNERTRVGATPQWAGQQL